MEFKNNLGYIFFILLIYDMTKFRHFFPIIDHLYRISSDMFLLGSIDINRWILARRNSYTSEGMKYSLYYDDDYTFHIY